MRDTGTHDAVAKLARPGWRIDPLSGREFFHELRHVVGVRAYAKLVDPLASLTDQIASEPAISRSRLILRILIALVHERGEFLRAEIGALDAVSLAKVIELIDLRLSRTRTEEEWAAAVAAAERSSA